MKLELYPHFNWEMCGKKKQWVCKIINWCVSIDGKEHVVYIVQNNPPLVEKEVTDALGTLGIRDALTERNGKKVKLKADIL